MTLTSLAKGVGVHQQTVIDWVRRKLQTTPDLIEVRVGAKRNVKATAYPVAITAAFVDYLADKGNLEAKALRTATFIADLERSIKEANGVQVTAAQHEENRVAKRIALLEQWAAEASKGGTVPVSVDMIRNAGFTDTTDANIIYHEAIANRCDALEVSDPEFTKGLGKVNREIAQTLKAQLS